MDLDLLYIALVSAFSGFLAFVILLRWKAVSTALFKVKITPPKPQISSPELAKLVEALSSKLSDNVLLPDHEDFLKSANSYWAKQEWETTPACIVRPSNVQQLSEAIGVLKQEHDIHVERGQTKELFAIRGGGHSAVLGAASIKGGILIDLGGLNEVTPSKDGASVAIEAGARWLDVYTVLDAKGLAVVGGRNCHVGVGGLTLGGGLSSFSPQYGLVCSNVVSYEVVLATGSIVAASESSNRDLWSALKGGANNFGIVTKFTLRSFPSSLVWSGFLYIPPFKADQVLAAFHESVEQARPNPSGQLQHDHHAAGPIACFSYLQSLRISIISVNLFYTKAEGSSNNKWPSYWANSSFASIWPRIWSTCRTRTLSNATNELHSLNPPGRRQVLAATTVRNDPATLQAAHAAYRNALATVRHIKGISWTLVMQPFVPDWARKGQSNPLGLNEGGSEALVNISFTVNWGNAEDDERARAITRSTLESVDEFAKRHGTDHRYRYLNYCADWQRPFEGYGIENWEQLKETSAKYDPKGLFQKACRGGFKLDMTTKNFDSDICKL